MTTQEPKSKLNGPAAGTDVRTADAGQWAHGEVDSPRRSKQDWDEMMLDHAAIQRRAQEMRSEAAWAIAAAVRDWTLNLFRQGKAKAAAAAQAPLQSRIQSS
jgi:hypothetical protein